MSISHLYFVQTCSKYDDFVCHQVGQTLEGLRIFAESIQMFSCFTRSSRGHYVAACLSTCILSCHAPASGHKHLGFIVLCFSTRGAYIFNDVSPLEISMILLSGFIGILVGDYVWLASLKILGARRVIVVDTTKRKHETFSIFDDMYSFTVCRFYPYIQQICAIT